MIRQIEHSLLSVRGNVVQVPDLGGPSMIQPRGLRQGESVLLDGHYRATGANGLKSTQTNSARRSLRRGGWTNRTQQALSQIAFGGAHRCDFLRLISVLRLRKPEGKREVRCNIRQSFDRGIVAFQRQLLPEGSDSGRRCEAAQTLIGSMASYSQLK